MLKTFTGTVAAIALITGMAQAAEVTDTHISQIECPTGSHLRLITGGLSDDFAGSTEAIVPRKEITQIQNLIDYQNTVQKSFRLYDEDGENNRFIDTLWGIPAGVVSGYIFMKVKPTGSALSNNDTMVLGDVLSFYNNETQPWKRYAAHIALYDANNPNSVAALQWSNVNGVIGNDLSKISLKSDGVNNPKGVKAKYDNLLELVQDRKRLSIAIQDDTVVDFVKLALCVS